jgi:DNA-binding transcriptional LysR family regulator
MTVHACRAAGFTPRTRHQVDDFTTTLALVAAGQGVALVPQLGLAGPPPGVLLTQVPLQRRTNIAYRSGAGRHPAVTAVTAALRSAIPEELGGAR